MGRLNTGVLSERGYHERPRDRPRLLADYPVCDNHQLRLRVRGLLDCRNRAWVAGMTRQEWLFIAAALIGGLLFALAYLVGRAM